MRKLILGGIATALLASLPAHAEIKINPGPIKNATSVRDNARGTVWCELVPMVGTAPDVVAHIYNSSAVDDCTGERAAKADMDKLSAEAGVKVLMNPDRYWVIDKFTAFTAGEVVDFNGIKAQWVASMTPESVRAIVGSKPYSVGRITRDTEWLYHKGKPVYLLRTPEGKVWVLQVFTRVVDKTLSLETLDQLGKKLQLPEGWKFEVKVLDKELSLQPRWADGLAYIMRDNLGNTYQGCGFDKACSYLP